MIWKDQKAGQPCKGCGDILIDDPNPSAVHWLLHTKTMMTICGKTVIKGPDQTVEESVLAAGTKQAPKRKMPPKKDAAVSAMKDAMRS